MCDLGARGTLLIEDGAAPHTFDASSIRYEFLSESLAAKDTHAGAEGIRGTRGHYGDRIRVVQTDLAGNIVMDVSPLDLGQWLHRAMGVAVVPAAPVPVLSETLPEFGVLVTRGDDDYMVAGCKVGKLTIAGSPGGLIKCTVDIIGQSETRGATGAFAATFGTTAGLNDPLAWGDSIVTIAATPYGVDSFSLEIDNGLVAKFRNSTTATSICEEDRTVTLTLDAPNDTTTSLRAYQVTTPVAGALTFVNGAHGVALTFIQMVLEHQTPNIASRGEIKRSLVYKCFDLWDNTPASIVRSVIATVDVTP